MVGLIHQKFFDWPMEQILTPLKERQDINADLGNLHLLLMRDLWVKALIMMHSLSLFGAGCCSL